ncbi:hypothetical protein HN419_02055 [Candidatus Woesearchaeota archaeon]|jgi:hypothetical protein|nr:hypothetical protein [Candidatus Woesearchaeota archaeon]MBT3537219.1 hypothetical protein [Candidatus Woesearchaeota archaeon]MBT4698206.1 hypothetical protein [Candidatus Woesearchaeota archaeon]MBT4717749.1 hypothetical protein [Candidatus Woesearchaeota archaeon]MBT7106471.1 hypothetical protein [Candidatus Woesearchaeota archaeon]
MKWYIILVCGCLFSLVLSLFVFAENVPCGPVFIANDEVYGEICDEVSVCDGLEVEFDGGYCCVDVLGCMYEADYETFYNGTLLEGEEPLINITFNTFCRELGGEICDIFQHCTGKWIYTDDASSYCCMNGSCVVQPVEADLQEKRRDEIEKVMPDLEKTVSDDVVGENYSYYPSDYSLDDSSDDEILELLDVALFPIIFVFVIIFVILVVHFTSSKDEGMLNLIRKEVANLKRYRYDNDRILQYLVKKGYKPSDIRYVLKRIKK